MKRPVLASLLLAAAACTEGADPRPASWEYISAAILQPSCATASCHGPASAAAGLDFSDARRGYTSLTGLWVWVVDPTGVLTENCRVVDNVRVCQRLERPLVNPYNPSQSRLVHVLRAQGSPRMPPDRPLSEADILLVERWILEGAHERMDQADDGDAPLTGPDAGEADAGGIDASSLDGGR